MWSGSISFGLVNIPVKLYAATSRHAVRFNQIDTRSGSRVRLRKVSEADGTEVPPEVIAKGYELPSGEYVVVSDDELAGLDPAASRTIDLVEFVDQESIDPIFYDSGYYLAPDQATVKAYALLLSAMSAADKVGIARFVMRGKEYLAAIRPQGRKLVLSTMLYADEIRDATEIPELDAVADAELNAKELKMAEQLIASLEADFDPSSFHDTYRDKVMELVEAKANGREGLVAAPTPVDDNKVVDLMAALEASVAEAKKARRRHPSGPEGDDATTSSAEASTARARPRKSRARKSA